MSRFEVSQLRAMAQSIRGVAMDADDPDDAAACTLAVDWMESAGNEIERLRELVQCAYVESALHFGFSKETGERALKRFNEVSDVKAWMDDIDAWNAEQESPDPTEHQ
jgi:hypothetical protein